MANYQSVMDYFNMHIENSKKSAELDHIQEQIQVMRRYRSDIDKLVNSKFSIQLESDDMDYFINYYMERIRLLRELTEKETETFKMYLFMLRRNYDSNNTFYQAAREKFARLQYDFSYALSELHKKERMITSTADTNMVSLLTRIIKPTSNHQYRISGNINKEEYEMILDLLNQSSVSIEERMAFIRELNSSIAKFKYQKAKITERIEIEISAEDVLEKEKTPIKSVSTKKMADYNYDRILRARALLAQDFDGHPPVLKVSEDTPYNLRERRLLYYLPNKEGIDYNTILYDLNTFINPDHLDEMFQTGKIHSKEELDTIRNRIYVEIINIVNNYKKKKLTEEPEEVEPIEEGIVPESIEEETIIPKEETHIEIEEEPIGEKLLQEYKLSDEQIHQVEEAIAIAEEYKKNFYQVYPYNSVVLQSCLEIQSNEGYQFSLDMAELIIKYIPQMMRTYNDYQFYSAFIRQSSQEDKDAIELFVDTKDLLLSNVTEVLNLIETMPLNELESSSEEKKEDTIPSFNHTNFVLIYQDPEKGPLLLQEDVEESLQTGNVSPQQIANGFETLYNLSTINPRKNTCNKIKASKSSYDAVAKKYNPRRHRQKDMRYPFINIYMCEEMKSFLMDYYHETLPQIRLQCVYMLFYKRGETTGYTDAMKRLSDISGNPNQVGSIEWIKTIFSEPFTEEKRSMAVQLLENSAHFIENLQKTIQIEDPKDIEKENIMEGEMTNAAK